METIGYCTNVHAGLTWSAARDNLAKYACAVRDLSGQQASLGVGLWLPNSAVHDILSQSLISQIRDWLQEQRLVPFTMNGFPYGDFHQAVVKHRVYEPTWWDRDRLEYTRGLVRILSELLPEGSVGSISTLPIAWGSPVPSDAQFVAAADHLSQLSEMLHRTREETGRTILVAIEAEPGCLLGDCASLRKFFQRYLLQGPHADRNKQYLTVCHDVCHSAVMREDQGLELQAYRDLGIRIGKVQVSSAIEVDWDTMIAEDKAVAMDQLKSFAEDRYLHQTTVRTGPAGSVRLVEDLPQLIASVDSPEQLSGSWRVHFHVPIFLREFGKLKSTQAEIERCVHDLIRHEGTDWFTGHWEVETYAWGVLPKELATGNLAAGIAEELAWFRQLLENVTAGRP